MESIYVKILDEFKRSPEISAKSLAHRLGVKRPLMFSALFFLYRASLVTSAANPNKNLNQRLMWRAIPM